MPHVAMNDYINNAKYDKVMGHNIAHWSQGQGETIVLVHGFPSASWDWHKIWQALHAKYQVIAIDLLGFGLSDKPHPYKYSVIEQADIIEHVLKRYRITNCHVLAHDYGVSVAQELLCRSNENINSQSVQGISINSICFLNGGLFAESHRPLLTQKLLKGRLGSVIRRFMSKRSLHKSFKRIFGKSTPPQKHEIDVLWSLLKHNHGKAVLPSLLSYIDERHVHRDRWVSNMQISNTPLYFINGIQDPISGKHMLEQYNEVIPNPHSTGIDVGHYPQIEAPDEIQALYLAFVNQHSQS